MVRSSASTVPSAANSSKSHYVILDGLRGVASLMVVLFHLFEAWSGGNHARQIINHGYLAVDFFFLLSGFVVAYAYDDRWDRMTPWAFCKRRLVRLQPMVIMGALLGAVMFPFQNFSMFPGVADATTIKVVVVLLLGCVMVPVPPSLDVRQWGESFPLNGPAWSLFYEYLANALYAVLLRRLPIATLAILTAIAAGATIELAVFGRDGDLIGGWGPDITSIQIGLTRVMFPFLAGILLMRVGKRLVVPHSFAWSSALLLIVLSLPRFGGSDAPWLNGAYEALCVIVVFPLIVAIGAGNRDLDGRSIRVARFFGALSYPLYITHYPLIYIYTGWVGEGDVSITSGIVAGLFVLVGSIVIAWLSLRFYDEPVRRWLSKRLLGRSG